MGKRELLIAVTVVVIGFGVYRFTAPPGDPSRSGFSLSAIVNEIRREIRGQRVTADATFTAAQAVPETVTEIRLAFNIGAVTIVGEDRDDVEAEMHVRSTGYDTEEATRLAKASHLQFDEAGALLIIAGKFPVEGRQTPTLRLKVPARLGVRMDEKGSTLQITNVASVLIAGGRGDTTIERVAGSVTVTQRGSDIVVRDVGALRLTTLSGAEARVSDVRGDAAFSLQSGEVRAEGLRGGLEVESRNTELLLDRLENLKGPVRINANLGEVVLVGLRADTRIDGRRTEIRVDLAGGGPLAIYNDGDEVIEVTVPSAGFTIDAVAAAGRVSLDPTLEEAGLRLTTTGGQDDDSAAGAESRVAGTVGGGGSLITLRARRGGDIVLKAR
jgi:hypothetical protein